jgi:hypothetical protein
MANKNLREMFLSISENIDLGGFNMEDIPELELPENFNDEFHKNYLTLLSAKNNPDLMGHFKGKYLSSADLKIKNGFLANGGTEEEFNELKSQEPDTLKLVDLIFDKVKDSKSVQNPGSGNKEFEKYKADTAKQIENLLGEKDAFDSKLESVVSETNSKWIGRLKKEAVNSRLNSKTYNNGMDKEDAIYLINRKIEDSNFVLALDSELNEKVYDKINPEMEAIVDGKNVSWDSVLDLYSLPYTQKNAQPPVTPVREVTIPSVSTTSGDGRYIVGHPDYGKA